MHARLIHASTPPRLPAPGSSPEYRTRASALRTVPAVAIVCLATACLLASGQALAQPGDWYAAVAGTASSLRDVHSEVEGLPDPPVTGGRVEHDHFMDTGYGLQAAVGRRFKRFRLEAELGHVRDKGHGYELNVPVHKPHKASDESHESTRLMLNAYLDFGKGRLRPYLGAGAGYARVKMRFFGQHAIIDAAPQQLFFDDTDSGSAWQLIAGAAWQLSPSLALTAQYRWLDAGTLEVPDRSGFTHQRDHAGGNVDLGLRFDF